MHLHKQTTETLPVANDNMTRNLRTNNAGKNNNSVKFR